MNYTQLSLMPVMPDAAPVCQPKPARPLQRKAAAKPPAQKTVDQLIEDAAKWYGVILNFNANPTQSARGYSEAQEKFNAAFEALSRHFQPAQIIAFCMEEVPTPRRVK
jgi:4-aminobutyrate aminotransferase-like enzyme